MASQSKRRPVSAKIFSEAPLKEPKKKVTRVGGGSNLPLYKILKSCPIQKAIGLLRSTSFTDESKGEKPLFDPEVIKVARAMFSTNKTYRFVIHASVIFQTGAAGQSLFSFPWTPAISTFVEWNSLITLFDECKLMHNELQLVSIRLPTSTVPANVYIVAPDHAITTSVTASAATTLGYAESQTIQGYNMDNGSGRHIQRTNVSVERAWGSVLLPTSLTTDVGMNGSWYISGVNPGPNTTNEMHAAMYVTVKFRNRI